MIDTRDEIRKYMVTLEQLVRSNNVLQTEREISKGHRSCLEGAPPTQICDHFSSNMSNSSNGRLMNKKIP